MEADNNKKTPSPRSRKPAGAESPRRASAGDTAPALTPQAIEHFEVGQAIAAAENAKVTAVSDILKAAARQTDGKVSQTLEAILAGASPDDIEALRATLKSEETDYCPDLTEPDPSNEAPPTVTRLTDTRLLVSTRCWSGAYNVGYGYWTVNQAPPYQPELVTTSGSEYQAGVLSATGRQLADQPRDQRAVLRVVALALPEAPHLVEQGLAAAMVHIEDLEEAFVPVRLDFPVVDAAAGRDRRSSGIPAP